MSPSWLCPGGLVALYESVYFAINDVLNVPASGERLMHTRRIDVELDPRVSARHDIALEVWWDVHGKGIGARVHSRIHFAPTDKRGRHKLGRGKSIDYSRGKQRLILIDDRDRDVAERFRNSGGHDVN